MTFRRSRDLSEEIAAASLAGGAGAGGAAATMQALPDGSLGAIEQLLARGFDAIGAALQEQEQALEMRLTTLEMQLDTKMESIQSRVQAVQAMATEAQEERQRAVRPDARAQGRQGGRAARRYGGSAAEQSYTRAQGAGGLSSW